MIVKKEEWDKLSNYKEELEKQYKEGGAAQLKIIDELKAKVKELEEQKKPDSIEVTIYTRLLDTRGYWIPYYNVQIDKSDVDLSSGVRLQVLKIFRKSIETLRKNHELAIKGEMRQYKEKENDKKLKIESLLQKLPRFTTKKKVLTIYKQLYEN